MAGLVHVLALSAHCARQLRLGSSLAGQLASENERITGAFSTTLTPIERARLLDGQHAYLKATVLRQMGRTEDAASFLRTAEAIFGDVRGGRVVSIMWLRAQVLGELAELAERSGEQRALRVVAHAEWQDGACQRIHGITQDITPRKRRERAQEQERVRLDNIVRSMNAGVWEWDVARGQISVNDEWVAMLGHTLDDFGPLTYERWVELLHPDDVGTSVKHLSDHFHLGKSHYESRFRLRHRDGHWVWVRDRGRVITWTPEGQPEWMYGTHRDITASKQAQQRLAASEDLLSRTGHVAGVGGWARRRRAGEQAQAPRRLRRRHPPRPRHRHPRRGGAS